MLYKFADQIIWNTFIQRKLECPFSAPIRGDFFVKFGVPRGDRVDRYMLLMSGKINQISIPQSEGRYPILDRFLRLRGCFFDDSPDVLQNFLNVLREATNIFVYRRRGSALHF